MSWLVCFIFSDQSGPDKALIVENNVVCCCESMSLCGTIQAMILAVKMFFIQIQILFLGR